MQQFSTTLAGSHSPHDQSNSLSLFLSPIPSPLNCIRHAPRTVACEELQFVCIELTASCKPRITLLKPLPSNPLESRVCLLHTQIYALYLPKCGSFSCEHPAHAFHGGAGAVQHQGQRPVSPASRVENHAALSKLVPGLYLGSCPALML